jgi:hypothetical protein
MAKVRVSDRGQLATSGDLPLFGIGSRAFALYVKM